MHMENVKKFMELVKAEESLAKRILALKDGLQEGEFAFKNDKEFVEKKILPLAKEYGIEFSVEDFMEFTSSQLTSLSKEELAEVSGGFPGIGLLIGLSVFLGGAATPTIASKAVSYFTGGGTATVQSVTNKEANMSGAAGAKEKGNTIEFYESFKAIKKEFSKRIKTAFAGVKSYMSPEERSLWMNVLVNKCKPIDFVGINFQKFFMAKYNETKDRIEFTATWDNRLKDQMDSRMYSKAALNDKLSNILKQQYDLIYSDEIVQLRVQAKTYKGLLAGKKAELGNYSSITEFNAYINAWWKRVNELISELQPSVKGTLNTNTDFNALKNQLMQNGYNIDEKGHTVIALNYSNEFKLIDQIIYCKACIATVTQYISNINKLTEEIQKLEQSYDETCQKLNLYEETQTAFSNSLKTELDYFFNQLLMALKEDNEISELVKKATTDEAKATLANKIKEKAEQLVQKQFSKQLLNGCSLVVGRPDDRISVTINYKSQPLHAYTFNADYFINVFNTLPSPQGNINSEASKERIADEPNKMANIQAMDANREDNKGPIEYTPFGRKLWNSIGSQAQHVLNMLNQINNLSDVKNKEAFENDLKYVAKNILTKNNAPYGLQGAHHTDTSIEAADLQRIKNFYDKIRHDN